MAPKARESIFSIRAYTPGKSSVPAAQRSVKLASNENPLGPSPKAVEAYQSAAGNLHRYPDGGAAQLREAIAGTYGLDASRIVCGSGSDELLGLLTHAYCDPGDTIVYSRYGFLMYKIYALAAGAIPIAAAEKNFKADVDSLLAAVTERTKILFLANPNNPTGSYLSKSELARLADGLSKHVLLVIDSAYTEYADAPDYDDGMTLANTRENIVVTRTFSKIHALAALRLGWLYCPAAVADALNRIRAPFNVNAPAQAAGIAALKDKAHLEASRAHNAEQKARLESAFHDLGLTSYPSQGNFLLVEFTNASAINQALIAEGILLREVEPYGLPNMLRITVGLKEENTILLDTLARLLK